MDGLIVEHARPRLCRGRGSRSRAVCAKGACAATRDHSEPTRVSADSHHPVKPPELTVFVSATAIAPGREEQGLLPYES